jgi:hypothetical protein
MLAKHHLTEVELGLVANLSVETADEARKLVPTLDVSVEEAAVLIGWGSLLRLLGAVVHRRLAAWCSMVILVCCCCCLLQL